MNIQIFGSKKDTKQRRIPIGGSRQWRIGRYDKQRM